MNSDDRASDLEQALARLRAGELVVIPTETVYGLAADAENPAAVARIFVLKGRPPSRPLIAHIASADDLGRWATAIPDYAYRLAEAFWPGPLSLVLRRSDRVVDAVTGGQDTVALRVPGHPLTLRLLEAFGGAVAAPSANRYGRISPTTPAHVRAQFGERTPFVLDGGPCSGGIESTIVACVDDAPRILRPGLIGEEAIAEVAGMQVSTTLQPTAELRTAGQDASHYAPRTATVLVDRDDPASWPDVARRRAGFLGFGAPPSDVTLDRRLPDDPSAAANRLYAELHDLDDAGLDLIVVEAPPPGSAWDGVRDRLRRAGAASADEPGLRASRD
ncbi:MAG: L-threonylcarbamoyladenylate synthase [Planctomycetota bacterium]